MRAKKVLSFILLLTLFTTVLTRTPVLADSDLLISNYSFENGLTGWTQNFGTGGIADSTAQHYTGSYSCKIVDTSTTIQWGIESTKLSASAGTEYAAEARVYIDSGSADLYIRFWNS